MRHTGQVQLIGFGVLLTAAAIALVLAATPGRSNPTPSPIPPNQPRTYAAPPPALSPLTFIAPWHAQPVRWGAAHARPLAADATSLYAFGPDDLYRIDPTTGGVLASRRYDPGLPYAALMNDELWVVPTHSAGRSVTAQAFDAHTLAPVGTIALPLPPRADAEVAFDVPQGLIYVAVDSEIYVLDTAHGRVVRRLGDGAEAPLSLAITPDGTRLYLADVRTTRVAQWTELEVIDSHTGKQAATSIRFPGMFAAPLAATRTGVWIATSSAHSEALGFYPTNRWSTASTPGYIGAGGGWGASATVEPNVVWLGGTSAIACADPVSGAFRASEALWRQGSSGNINITSLIPAGRDLFAYYLGDAPAGQLIRLTPPAACLR